MKYGIYYAYWEKEWGGDFLPYIEKVKRLGFDILEVACGNFNHQPMSYFEALRDEAKHHSIQLTGGYGPRPEHNIHSADDAVVANAFSFYEDIFPKMAVAGINSIGGALYSYWPVDYSKEPDISGDWRRSVGNMRRLADIAEKHGISLYMEVLNRFEGYLLNEAAQAVRYVEEVDRSNVKVMLDAFHMNIEEDSILDAIRMTGKHLAELHIGEANRRPPRQGRMPWHEIGDALRDIGFDGKVVMEPFVTMGGQVGRDIKIWRDLTNAQSATQLDTDAATAVAFIRDAFDEQ